MPAWLANAMMTVQLATMTTMIMIVMTIYKKMLAKRTSLDPASPLMLMIRMIVMIMKTVVMMLITTIVMGELRRIAAQSQVATDSKV